jgi:anti-sigma factor ChrR (cupin superfamily)
MTDEHPDIERLNEYLDRELESRELRRIESHLSQCGECRKAVDDLSEIVRAAGELPPVEPPERIWESIASALQGRGAPSRASWWRASLSPALAAAAAVVLAVSLWLALGTEQGEVPADQAALAAMVTRELEAAESHYDKAIVGLEQIIDQNEGVLPQELASVLNRNLDLIENAIRESRTAIATHPESPVAQESLLQALKSKVTLLQNTILLINEIRKGQGENAMDLIEEMRKKTNSSNPI